MAVAHLAEGAYVLADVDDVIVDLDGMLGLGAYGVERRLQVPKRLLGLRLEPVCHFAAGVETELARDIDDSRWPGDLDHVGIAGRLGDGRRIDEARVRHFPLPGLCPCMPPSFWGFGGR